MKYLFVSVLVFAVTYQCNAQKPSIDFNVFNKWPSLGRGKPVISNDGKYCLYSIINVTPGESSIVVQSIKDNWQMELMDASNICFTNDSRNLIYLKKDSLRIRTLKTHSEIYIPDVSSFKLFVAGKNEWLLYQQKTEDRKLVLQNFTTGDQQSFLDISHYVISKDCSTLLLNTEKQYNSSFKQQLIWVDILSKKNKIIWEGVKARSFIFDVTGMQVGFIVDSFSYTNRQTSVKPLTGKSIWYYKAGEDKAIIIVDDSNVGLDNNLKIGDDKNWEFSEKGDKLFFTVMQNEQVAGAQNKVKANVDIWNYADPIMNPRQLEKAKKNYKAVINCATRRIIRLENENEELRFSNNNFALICYRKGDYVESYWNTSAEQKYYLISFVTGRKKQMDNDIAEPIGFSPNEKYLVYKDVDGNLKSYELADGKTNNISEKLPVSLLPEKYDISAGGTPLKSELAGWKKYNDGLLFYDKYDIWELDLTGKNAPVNLTNGMGRIMKIQFRILQFSNIKPIISDNQGLLLSAINIKTKEAGYYILNRKGGDPQQLWVGPFHQLGYPVKASSGNHYLVLLESASKSPNLYHTSDFKRFDSLTDIHPERDYNWLTSEVVTFKTLDGREAQGALYKPENFDPRKRYPVIFYYYGAMSDQVNHYEEPEPAQGWINIPWFVSRGYIVFCPDIYSALGEAGIAAYNSVVGAAKRLIRFPWIDSTHMAIHGHSYGGFENNYIVTHTDIFSAALTSAGVSNMVSAYSTSSTQSMFESGQYRLGGSIWENKKGYLDQSPVLYADKVSTPLLMLANKNDKAVSFAQGVEFFSALRRLGKRAWMLQYDGETHSLSSEDAMRDYTIRITQFFNHYLKDSAAPKWMLYGVPAKMKAIDDGLDLINEKDKDGRWITPGPGLVRKESYKIY